MNNEGNYSREEFLLEYRQIGSQMRIAAIDAKTGIEVIAIAPLSATQQQMEQLAINKLRKRIEQINSRV